MGNDVFKCSWVSSWVLTHAVYLHSPWRCIHEPRYVALPWLLQRYYQLTEYTWIDRHTRPYSKFWKWSGLLWGAHHQAIAVGAGWFFLTNVYATSKEQHWPYRLSLFPVLRWSTMWREVVVGDRSWFRFLFILPRNEALVQSGAYLCW